MKNLVSIFILSSILCIFFTLQSFKGGNFDIYKCSHEVKGTTRPDGFSSEKILSEETKTKKTIVVPNNY